MSSRFMIADWIGSRHATRLSSATTQNIALCIRSRMPRWWRWLSWGGLVIIPEQLDWLSREGGIPIVMAPQQARPLGCSTQPEDSPGLGLIPFMILCAVRYVGATIPSVLI